MIVTNPCRFKRKEGKTFSSFLKDLCELCVTCQAQNYSVDLRYDHYSLWSADKQNDGWITTTPRGGEGVASLACFSHWSS